jgi:hypothetical protein
MGIQKYTSHLLRIGETRWGLSREACIHIHLFNIIGGQFFGELLESPYLMPISITAPDQCFVQIPRVEIGGFAPAPAVSDQRNDFDRIGLTRAKCGRSRDVHFLGWCTESRL